MPPRRLEEPTECCEHQRELQHLNSILESPELAVIALDLDGRVATWNHGAERIYGYAAEEVLGQPFSAVIPPERQAELARWLKHVGRGQPAGPRETIGLTKHGSTIDVALTLSPICDGEGPVRGAMAMARDITNQRWTAATLETTLRALESALNAAQESEYRSRRFLADAAHQLRSPIAGIQACAATLLRGADDSRSDILLANVMRETSRAARLMTGLLHMARVDQGETRARATCDVVSLCAEEADRLRVVASEIDVAVRVRGDAGNRPECDPDALREILANLLDNARRHATKSIELVISTSAEAVEVRVVDDGPGLPEELRERAFDRFVSLDGKGGSGLGLPIARGLARAHGGDLTYEGGFVLRLPMRPPEGWGPWGGQVPPSTEGSTAPREG